MLREEETHTLVFVDMLGWAAFTQEHPTRTQTFTDEDGSRTLSATTPLQARINRFQKVLRAIVDGESLSGPVNSMIFSDCAFLDLGTSLRAALTAKDLMRSFVRAGVPVRMGLGRGTYYVFEFSVETDGDSTKANLSFAGTAVIWSHAAERCGGKGMRIFLHPSLTDEFAMINRSVRVLKLPAPFHGATAELDYMEDSDDEIEQILAGSVSSIKPMQASAQVALHYSETLDAMNRMRVSRGKPAITTPQFLPGLKDD